MRFLLLVFPCLMMISDPTLVRADFDVIPYAFGGKIMTGGHDDVLGLDNLVEHVFNYTFGEDPLDPNIIGDPGFNNGTFAVGHFPNNGLLPTSSTLGFDILTSLEFWDGGGGVSFTAAPAGVALGITRGSTTVLIDALGPDGPTPTIGNTGAAGRLHVHVQSTLNFTDGTNPNLPNAPDGIYLLGLRMTLTGSGVANSDPIYFLYSNNASEAGVAEASAWVEANLVPEPSTWTLGAIACTLLVAAGWRGRRDRPAVG